MPYISSRPILRVRIPDAECSRLCELLLCLHLQLYDDLQLLALSCHIYDEVKIIEMVWKEVCSNNG